MDKKGEPCRPSSPPPPVVAGIAWDEFGCQILHDVKRDICSMIQKYCFNKRFLSQCYSYHSQCYSYQTSSH